ncbi:MAG: hypothetical protein FWE91_04030 [Defluviitaleaceae bacterium]|nr:hypothetical protein [Defluviitaleaceae bacterium]MCL2837239.1 hypothetical protein [Defluviitaleaceae bacterium]
MEWLVSYDLLGYEKPVLSTTVMGEAIKLCNYAALLHKGKIVEQGVPVEICERHDSFKTVPDLESVFIKLTGVTLE